MGCERLSHGGDEPDWHMLPDLHPVVAALSCPPTCFFFDPVGLLLTSGPMVSLYKWHGNSAHGALKAEAVRRQQLTLKPLQGVLAEGDVKCKHKAHILRNALA